MATALSGFQSGRPDSNRGPLVPQTSSRLWRAVASSGGKCRLRRDFERTAETSTHSSTGQLAVVWALIGHSARVGLTFRANAPERGPAHPGTAGGISCPAAWPQPGARAPLNGALTRHLPTWPATLRCRRVSPVYVDAGAGRNLRCPAAAPRKNDGSSIERPTRSGTHSRASRSPPASPRSRSPG